MWGAHWSAVYILVCKSHWVGFTHPVFSRVSSTLTVGCNVHRAFSHKLDYGMTNYWQSSNPYLNNLAYWLLRTFHWVSNKVTSSLLHERYPTGSSHLIYPVHSLVSPFRRKFTNFLRNNCSSIEQISCTVYCTWKHGKVRDRKQWGLLSVCLKTLKVERHIHFLCQNFSGTLPVYFL